MAISPKDRYPGQVDLTDLAGYPEGAARNITVPGDGTGFPLERDWVNDWLGFSQSLLAFAGATPTGTPDKVGASQLIDSLALFIDQHGFINLGAIDASISNDLTVGGDATFDGTITVDTGATFQCDGTADFTGVATFDFPVALVGGFTATGAAVHNGTLTVNGVGVGLKVTTAAEIDGTALVSGILSAPAGILVGTGGIIVGGGGGLLVTGGTTLQGPVELADPVTITGNGRILERVTIGVDSNASYGPGTTDIVWVSTLTGAVDYTIDDSGAVDGDRIIFTTMNDTNNVSIKKPGGALMAVIKFLTGFPHSIEAIRIAGVWQILRYNNT